MKYMRAVKLYHQIFNPISLKSINVWNKIWFLIVFKNVLHIFSNKTKIREQDLKNVLKYTALVSINFVYIIKEKWLVNF